MFAFVLLNQVSRFWTCNESCDLEKLIIIKVRDFYNGGQRTFINKNLWKHLTSLAIFSMNWWNLVDRIDIMLIWSINKPILFVRIFFIKGYFYFTFNRAAVYRATDHHAQTFTSSSYLSQRIQTGPERFQILSRKTDEGVQKRK